MKEELKTRESSTNWTSVASKIAAMALVGTAAYVLLRKPLARAGGPVRLTRSITVMRPREEVYRFWRDLSNLPRFMEHLEKVTVLDDKRSRWVAKGPAEVRLEWEAEITQDRPGERLAWRSLPGSELPNWGVVHFQDLGPQRGTLVQLEMMYEPPAGHLGVTLAKLIGQNPEQQVANDLRRLQQVLETGHAATTEGQPVGKGQPAEQGRKVEGSST
ncbi:Polyketide cyclase / dehydrase and lipid transport [Calidithermus terrae]|uniref:Polyketide cyclase / dehydrase and lipid transport n=1 Tax=Calidithermus terrae TaxID=1408545 RepID=A0A399EBH8_9DEIN|nr:SRPBCC family protein [Calidithermus terrae]RIH82004.1 Polyketide cyclase / dehydrase and lipid transport [Calidithermus terrae]